MSEEAARPVSEAHHLSRVSTSLARMVNVIDLFGHGVLCLRRGCPLLAINECCRHGSIIATFSRSMLVHL